MPAAPPDPAEIKKAISIYVGVAYGSEPPFVVRSQIGMLENWGGQFMRCPVFAASPETPPSRYTIRLGNPSYPHMKLALEMAPGSERFIYRVDTHDRHICPASSSPDHASFSALMEKNQKLAESIENAWEQAGLRTFKAELRDDLRRRQSAAR
jgi:hypothetical protein